jgi:hypothetical protein
MKVLLNIVHFQTPSKHYLNEVIEEYNNYPFEVDIFIHSNKKKIKNLNLKSYKNGDLFIKKHNTFIQYFLFKNKNYYLTWTPRKVIKKNIKKYDIFIYSEDDILIPVKAFKYWFERKDELLSLNFLPGFIRLETNNQGEEIAVDFENMKLSSQMQVSNHKYLINDQSRYTACWIYDKKMMKTWITSEFYNIRRITTDKAMRSNFLDKLKIKNIYMRYWLYDFKNKKGFGIRENSAYGMHSENVPILKGVLLPLTNGQLDEKSKIYHLSNSYADSNHPDIGNTKLKDII